MLFIRSVFLSFTTWVLTALVNALLGGAWLYFFSEGFGQWTEFFLLMLIFTLLFSMPAALVFWITLLVNKSSDRLFGCMLQTGIILAASSSLLLYLVPADMVNNQRFSLSVFNIISTIISVMIHHTRIISFSQKNITTNDV